MKDIIEFQKQRIEALEKLVAIREDFINEQAKIIDETQFKYADAQAKYNMLVRNITVIDAEFENPIKN